jgi:hypothetical protein
MDAAWIGLVGALLGGILGFGGIYVMERSRRGYELADRFLAERRGAYGRLLAASSAVEQAFNDRTADLELRRERPDLSVRVRPKPDLSAVDQAVAEIGLVAPYEVEMRAAALSQSLRSLGFAVDLIGDVDTGDSQTDLRTASGNVHDTRREFLIAAKADLDLPSGAFARRQELIVRIRRRLGVPERRLGAAERRRPEG